MDRTTKVILIGFGVFFVAVILWILITVELIVTMPPIGDL